MSRCCPVTLLPRPILCSSPLLLCCFRLVLLPAGMVQQNPTHIFEIALAVTRVDVAFVPALSISPFMGTNHIACNTRQSLLRWLATITRCARFFGPLLLRHNVCQLFRNALPRAPVLLITSDRSSPYSVSALVV